MFTVSSLLMLWLFAIQFLIRVSAIHAQVGLVVER